MKVLVLALMLAGCATAPATIRYVDRPVPTPCISDAAIPRVPAPPPIGAERDSEQRAAWMGLRIEQLRSYSERLRAALIACSKVKGGEQQ